MGRPLKFKTVQELEKALDKYFDKCRVPTVEGMALALDVDRKTLLNYGKREEYFPTIRRSRQRVAAFLNEGMLLNELHAQGTMFNLRNNFGYTDKPDEPVHQEVVIEIK